MTRVCILVFIVVWDLSLVTLLLTHLLPQITASCFRRSSAIMHLDDFFHRYILKESVCLKAGDHFIKMSPFLPCLWPWNEHQLTTPSWYVIWRVQPAGSMSLLLRRVLLTSCTGCITRPIQHHSSLSSPAFITSTICIRQQEHLPPMFGRCPVML